MQTVIVPLGNAKNVLPDPRDIMITVENSMEMTASAIKRDFKTTTKTWKTRVDFKIEQVAPYHKMIYTNNDIYGYVNYGTRPHPIEAKNAPYLVFQWGGPGSYVPKTRPEWRGGGGYWIGSRKGGSSGPIVRRKKVKHPGTKARDFDKKIAKKWQKEFPKQVQRAINSRFKIV